MRARLGEQKRDARDRMSCLGGGASFLGRLWRRSASWRLLGLLSDLRVLVLLPCDCIGKKTSDMAAQEKKAAAKAENGAGKTKVCFIVYSRLCSSCQAPPTDKSYQSSYGVVPRPSSD
jgi:hypothetical protein